MKLRCFQKLARKIVLCSCIAAAIYFVFLAGVAKADDIPAFRSGMWEFNRTTKYSGSPGEQRTTTIRKCTNPTEDMKNQNEMIKKNGCSISPISKSGNTYTFTTQCRNENTKGQSKTVMTVENDSAYDLKIETVPGPPGTSEQLRARRTGDCAK